MRLFSKFNVLNSLFHSNIRNTTYMVDLLQHRLCSVQVEKIYYFGEAYTIRKYGTAEVNTRNKEKQEVFFPLNNKTSLIANKVALVVGGSQEMGLLCVKNLLSGGAKAIMIADTDEKEGSNVICELSEEYGGDKTAFIKTDLDNIKLLRNAFNWTKKHFKGIDIVVNIARSVQSESWQEQLEKNVEGIVRGTLLGIEYMGTHHGGRGGSVFNMVTTSSTTSADECPIFVGARHFVIGFGRSMSRRYAKVTGVKVVTLCAEEEDSNDVTEGACRKETTSCDFSSLVRLAKSGSVWST